MNPTQMQTSLSRQELLIWGYIREIERRFQFRNIPQDISDLIYLFQKCCDEWSKKYTQKDYIFNSMNIIEADSLNHMTAYGSRVISEGQFSWRIKMIKYAYHDFGAHPPYVGIIEDNEEYMNAYLNNCNFEQYGYQLSSYPGLFGRADRNLKKIEISKENFTGWKFAGAVLEIELDLDKLTLKFMVNDDTTSILGYQGIKKARYRLALSVTKFKGSQFQFL